MDDVEYIARENTDANENLVEANIAVTGLPETDMGMISSRLK